MSYPIPPPVRSDFPSPPLSFVFARWAVDLDRGSSGRYKEGEFTRPNLKRVRAAPSSERKADVWRLREWERTQASSSSSGSESSRRTAGSCRWRTTEGGSQSRLGRELGGAFMRTILCRHIFHRISSRLPRSRLAFRLARWTRPSPSACAPSPPRSTTGTGQPPTSPSPSCQPFSAQTREPCSCPS